MPNKLFDKKAIQRYIDSHLDLMSKSLNSGQHGIAKSGNSIKKICDKLINELIEISESDTVAHRRAFSTIVDFCNEFIDKINAKRQSDNDGIKSKAKEICLQKIIDGLLTQIEATERFKKFLETYKGDERSLRILKSITGFAKAVFDRHLNEKKRLEENEKQYLTDIGDFLDKVLDKKDISNLVNFDTALDSLRKVNPYIDAAVASGDKVIFTKWIESQNPNNHSSAQASYSPSTSSSTAQQAVAFDQLSGQQPYAANSVPTSYQAPNSNIYPQLFNPPSSTAQNLLSEAQPVSHQASAQQQFQNPANDHHSFRNSGNDDSGNESDKENGTVKESNKFSEGFSALLTKFIQNGALNEQIKKSASAWVDQDYQKQRLKPETILKNSIEALDIKYSGKNEDGVSFLDRNLSASTLENRARLRLFHINERGKQSDNFTVRDRNYCHQYTSMACYTESIKKDDNLMSYLKSIPVTIFYKDEKYETTIPEAAMAVASIYGVEINDANEARWHKNIFTQATGIVEPLNKDKSAETITPGYAKNSPKTTNAIVLSLHPMINEKGELSYEAHKKDYRCYLLNDNYEYHNFGDKPAVDIQPMSSENMAAIIGYARDTNSNCSTTATATLKAIEAAEICIVCELENLSEHADSSSAYQNRNTVHPPRTQSASTNNKTKLETSSDSRQDNVDGGYEKSQLKASSDSQSEEGVLDGSDDDTRKTFLNCASNSFMPCISTQSDVQSKSVKTQIVPKAKYQIVSLTTTLIKFSVFPLKQVEQLITIFTEIHNQDNKKIINDLAEVMNKYLIETAQRVRAQGNLQVDVPPKSQSSAFFSPSNTFHQKHETMDVTGLLQKMRLSK